MFWNHPTLQEIGRKIEGDGHSGSSFAYVMRFMESIRKRGWSVVVQQHLEKNRERLGILNRVQGLI